ncbi:GAF and ANTAR domain-containing protein [Mariniluteicoccus endophyticus]
MDSPEVTLAEIVDQLSAGRPEPSDVLQRVLDLSLRGIDGADGASVTIYGAEGKPFTTAVSHDWVLEVDRMQYETLQGPCLEVASTSAPVAGSADLAESEHWPVFGPQAAAVGVQAVLAAGLSSRPDPGAAGQPPGALNLYSRSRARFDEADRERAVLLAAIAGVTIALAEARGKNRRLNEALTSRDVIGQAKGILMERHGISADDAFSTLRRTSNQLNIKLRDVAERVTAEFTRPVRGRDKKTNLPKL